MKANNLSTSEAKRECNRRKADNHDIQWNLVRSAYVIKAEKPAEIPRGMTIKRYRNVLVQYGD